MAQPPVRTKTYTFNFANPETLIPSVTRSTLEGGGVPVTDKVFKSSDGILSLTFDNSAVNPKSDVRIVTANAANGKVPYLTFERSTRLNVSAQGAVLQYFRIPGSEVIGGLAFESTSPTATEGSFGPSSDYSYNIWENSSNKNITSLTLNNASPVAPVINTIEVCYELPRDILTPTGVSIANNAVLTSFSSIALTFANNMSITNDTQVTFTDGTNNYALTPTVSGKVVTLTSATPITADGNYTLTVAAGSFEDTEYFRNEALTYTFTILRNFEIQSVSPASGVVTSIPNGIVLTFEGAVGTVDGNMAVKITDGNNTEIRSATAAATATNQVTLTFSNPSAITENGIFTLTIPEKLVYDVAGTHYNAAITFTYNIGDLAPDELKEKAVALLAKTGVGYPTSGNAARAALSGMSATASTADYNTAITNYFQTTEVELPLSGNYYYLKAVAKGGAQQYIKYAGGAVSMTASVAEATPFKLEGSAGTYNFITPDNKYLTQLGSTTPVSTTAVSLTIAKLQVTAAGVSDEDVFGLFSLYGNHNGNNAYALVNMNGSFATNSGIGLVNFTTTLTNGFALEMVPDVSIPVPDAEYTLTPASGSSVSQLSTITIAFPNIASVSLANQSLIRLTKSDNTTINPASVTLATGKTNEYVITFTDVKTGSYTLTIGKGAFTYSYTLPNTNIISAAVQAIAATYNVTQGDDFIYDFTQIHTIYPYGPMNLDSPKDVDINNFIFFSNEVEIGVSNKIVEVVNYNTSEVIAQGKFKVVPYDNTLPEVAKDAKTIIKLVLDNNITAGSLPLVQYSYIIHEGTFGDTNFGAYNTDPAAFLATGKTKADCHANPYSYYIFKIGDGSGSGGSEGGGETKPSAEVLNKAKALLAKSGLGYPKTNATSRNILQGLVNSNSGSDDVYNAAILSYLGDTDIEMPVSDRYYTICAVSANGRKAYVDATGAITSDQSKAGLFKATMTSDGTAVSFKSADNKYLTVLTNDNNLSAAFNATVNNLKLNRIVVANDKLEASFGLVTITGVKNDRTLVAKVNITTPAIITTNNSISFANEVTCGFQLTETDPSVVPAPTPTMSINPESGSSMTSLQNVELTISGVDGVQLANKNKITLTDGKQNVTTVSAVTSLGGGKFRLAFPEVDGGEYTLSVAEGAFTFPFMERTVNVPAFIAYYSVKQYVSPEIMTLAKQMLEKTGVGYPTAGSQSRLILKGLVDAAGDTNLGSDKAFLAAIEAFRAETDIEKPASDKYYRIAAVSSSGFVYYLKNNGGRLSLTASEADGIVFKATANTNGTTTFATLYGDTKYLCLPTDGTAFSEVYTAANNNLTLARFKADGIDERLTLGRMSIGNGGKYAIADVSVLAVLTPRSTLSFGTDETSSFMIFEVDKSEIEMPDVSFTLTPTNKSTVKTLEKVTVAFTSTSKVSLSDASLIKLTDLRLNEYKPKAVKAVDGKENTFEMEFINLQASEYRLTIGKGTFVVNFLGSETAVQAIVADFTVESGVEFAPDYSETNTVEIAPEITVNEYVKDIDLNNLSFESSAVVVVDESKVVVIENSFGNEKARGHLELATRKDRTRAVATYVMKLVLDDEIKEGDLRSDTYTVLIPAAAFGDENFGKYLADPSSVSMSECHVNKKITFNIKVNNDKATGIGNIILTGDGSEPVYDLNGRRVENVVPGKVYIKNGKKFVIK